MRAVPEEMTVAVVASSAASSAEWLASCWGVGGVVGSATPGAQCLFHLVFSS